MRTPVFDHVLITEQSFYSFRDTGLLEELAKSEKYVPPYKLKERYRKEMLATLQTERQRSSAKIQESLEKGIRKGRKEGREAGVKEGMQQGLEKTAKQLLKDGEAIEKIVRWTGLSEEQLKQLTP